jgi:hypothetical protein
MSTSDLTAAHRVAAAVAPASVAAARADQGDAPAAPRRIVRRAARLAGPTFVALGAVFALAAFTDDARVDDNGATAASVTISADRAASAPLFAISDWRPEDAAQARCVTLTNDGSVAVPVSFGLARAATGPLADFVDVTVERGSGTAATRDGACAGFTAAGPVDLAPGAAGTGAELDELPHGAALVPDGGAPLAPGAARTYRITWTLQDTEAAEGLSVEGVDLRWRSTPPPASPPGREDRLEDLAPQPVLGEEREEQRHEHVHERVHLAPAPADEHHDDVADDAEPDAGGDGERQRDAGDDQERGDRVLRPAPVDRRGRADHQRADHDQRRRDRRVDELLLGRAGHALPTSAMHRHEEDGEAEQQAGDDGDRPVRAPRRSPAPLST